MLKALLWDEEGQGLAEYGVIVGIVALGAIGIMKAFSGEMGKIFAGLTGRLSAGMQ